MRQAGTKNRLTLSKESGDAVDRIPRIFLHKLEGRRDLPAALNFRVTENYFNASSDLLFFAGPASSPAGLSVGDLDALHHQCHIRQVFMFRRNDCDAPAPDDKAVSGGRRIKNNAGGGRRDDDVVFIGDIQVMDIAKRIIRSRVRFQPTYFIDDLWSGSTYLSFQGLLQTACVYREWEPNFLADFR